MQNAGLSKCKSESKSKSKSLPTHVLEKQLQEERARKEAPRLEVDEMRKRAEDKEALLEQAKQATPSNDVESTPQMNAGSLKKKNAGTDKSLPWSCEMVHESENTTPSVHS